MSNPNEPRNCASINFSRPLEYECEYFHLAIAKLDNNDVFRHEIFGYSTSFPGFREQGWLKPPTPSTPPHPQNFNCIIGLRGMGGFLEPWSREFLPWSQDRHNDSGKAQGLNFSVLHLSWRLVPYAGLIAWDPASRFFCVTVPERRDCA